MQGPRLYIPSKGCGEITSSFFGYIELSKQTTPATGGNRTRNLAIMSPAFNPLGHQPPPHYTINMQTFVLTTDI